MLRLVRSKNLRRPLPWSVILGGEHLAEHWGVGGACFVVVFGRVILPFDTSPGVVNELQCLRRGDVALFQGF